MLLTLHETNFSLFPTQELLSYLRAVVVILFCIGTHFQIITKTCTPLPCTKIYYCRSAKFLCCRRCL